MECPYCGAEAEVPTVDIGVGEEQVGPASCGCGAAQNEDGLWRSGAWWGRMQTKAEDKRYRSAAARLSGGSVRPEASVARPQDGSGAFVEAVVWVPLEEMQKEGKTNGTI